MTDPHIKWAIVAALSVLTTSYFVVVAWKAASLAELLLRAGYAAKGWTGSRLSARVRLVGVLGCAVSLVALLVSSLRVL